MLKFDKQVFKERLTIVTKGKAQKDIAKSIGVSPSTVSKWLSPKDEGNLPSIEVLMTIAEQYGCTVDYLLGGDNGKDDLPPGEIARMLFKALKYGYFNMQVGPMDDDCPYPPIILKPGKADAKSFEREWEKAVKKYESKGDETEMLRLVELRSIQMVLWGFFRDMASIRDSNLKEDLVQRLIETLAGKLDEDYIGIFMRMAKDARENTLLPIMKLPRGQEW